MMNKLKIIQDEEPWYAEGLHFECTGCGQCCTGSPGYVWVNEDEITTMADYLQISTNLFKRRYLRRVEGRWSLVEHSKTYDCIFLKDNKCEIYSARPIQCRTFPWWPQQLRSKEAWLEAAKHCEGISLQAPLVPTSTIEEQCQLLINTRSKT